MEIGSIAAVATIMAAVFGITWKLLARGRELARWRENIETRLEQLEEGE